MFIIGSEKIPLLYTWVLQLLSNIDMTHFVYKSTSFISTAIQVAEEAFIELENICHGSESLWRLNTLTGFVLLSGRLMSNSSTCVLLRALTCSSFSSILVIHNHFKSFFKNRIEKEKFFHCLWSKKKKIIKYLLKLRNNSELWDIIKINAYMNNIQVYDRLWKGFWNFFEELKICYI